MKQEIKVAKSTQEAIPEIGKKEQTLHYLIIGEEGNNVIINVGEKTYEKVNKLITTKTKTT